MKIYKIQTTSPNISFQAGKVHVFSDFDRTFLPTSQRRFKECQDKSYIQKMKAYFKNFASFFKNTRTGLKFTITTGRKFEEFLQFAEIAREKKVRIPLPDTLIVKNGTHEHLRTGSDKTFYRGGEFPFMPDVKNNAKEQKIKNMPAQTNITKQIDTKEAVEEAIKNNDLVIAAGDHYNDVEMLNPGLYLKDFFNQEMLNKYKDFSKITQNPKELIKLLDSDSKLADTFKKMPFIGIIMKHKNGENRLDRLEPFTKGPHQKLIVVEQENLKEGIKDAIKLYNKQNPEFEKELSKDLRKQIASSGGDDGNNPQKSDLWKYLLAGTGVILTGSGIYIYRKNRKKQNKTPNQQSGV